VDGERGRDKGIQQQGLDKPFGDGHVDPLHVELNGVPADKDRNFTRQPLCIVRGFSAHANVQVGLAAGDVVGLSIFDRASRH